MNQYQISQHVKFIVRQVKFNRFLNSKDFLISCKTFSLRDILNLGANFHGLRSLLSYSNIGLGEQLLLVTLSISFISKHGVFSKNGQRKNVPNF